MIEISPEWTPEERLHFITCFARKVQCELGQRHPSHEILKGYARCIHNIALESIEFLERNREEIFEVFERIHYRY